MRELLELVKALATMTAEDVESYNDGLITEGECRQKIIINLQTCLQKALKN